MYYISTRGEAPRLNFKEAFLTGLASDGGLYVPETYPTFSTSEIASFKSLNYQELCFKVMKPYVGRSLSDKILKEIINKSYKDTVFTHSAVAPLKQLNNQQFVMELFHGPTNAFKDFALQLIGHLLEYFLKQNKEKAIILGATSGDTGSAAIHGCKNCKRADIFILHPHNRTSDIQRKQMTTVLDKNVHNIAIKGNFDDAQSIVKHVFCNQEFINKKKRLIAVNSINWARICGQIVYYFYSGLALGAPERKVSFSVPTGNFGDIFAGYVAKKMGLPIEKLIVATNKNDILNRFINKYAYNKQKLTESLSPSMDIQISSNFERLLFDMHNGNAKKIKELMEEFNKTGKLSVSSTVFKKIQALFLASKSDDRTTVKTMQNIAKTTGEILDPHTAAGVKSAYEFAGEIKTPIITLATAHPGKFPIALKKAKLKLAELPDSLAKPLKAKEKFKILPNDAEKVISFVTKESL